MYPCPSPHPSRHFYLEAVTVCVGYGDFLNTIIPYNQPLFDEWVIVTTPQDRETREVCRRHGLKCLISEECYRDGADFCKGRLINLGLEHLSHQGWLLHLDADMVLPGKTRQLLKSAHLDPKCLYGCDRAMVKSHADWVRLRQSGWISHSYHHQVSFPSNLGVGARWVSQQHGYVPIGAFQLWHRDSNFQSEAPGIHVRPYPFQHNDASRGDIQFGLQWDRKFRHIVPELVAVHLESEPARLGANWRGRTTKPWGGAKQ